MHGTDAMLEAGLPPPSAEPAIDACWRRIGVRGDGSCERLAGFVHCRNCPVYAQAAVALLDTMVAGTSPSAGAPAGAPRATHQPGTEHGPALSCLVFRAGQEWLALPATALGEITTPCPIHSLPHRRHAAVLGVAGVRGQLLACISLATLLGGQAAAQDGAAPGTRVLVLGQGRAAIALPVNEVAGVERFAQDRVLPLPTTLSRVALPYLQGVLHSGGRHVGLLDPDRLRQALLEILA